MIFISAKGEQEGPPGALPITEETVQKVRDMIIVRLKSINIPERTIAKILGIRQPTVHKRYNRIPENVREQYARTTLV